MTREFISSLSSRTRVALQELGISEDAKLADVYVPSLLDAGVTRPQIRKIVIYLIANDMPVRFQVPDETWDSQRWQEFVASLVDDGILSWEEVAVAVLGELNPPQVGTRQASNPNIKRQYPHRGAMRAVMRWFYDQDGRCRKCGRRIHLEVDHIKGTNEFVREGRDPADADTLENLQLLCRRCNVTKRASHKLGGLSFATAQAALMWILLVERPTTLKEFERLCRAHGLAMANIRFEEAWAMAVWLAKAGMYTIEESIAEAVEEAVEESE